MLEEKPQIITLVVFLGGAIGGLARYGLSLVPVMGSWPLMTIFINCLGTAVLATLGTYMKGFHEKPAYIQDFVGTGICGGFTTFGALILESYQYLWSGQLVYLFLLIAASIAFALLSLKLGFWLGDVLVQRVSQEEQVAKDGK
ncbi:CrcB family protein [Fructobacillus sp. CRL 2054]|uniref:fluoride efflux transporter FluC n=1 Tax=Fructobacillus sp. CRL 2054 TaxID=2763007 RepID=UPI002379C3A9|nr:CrcB family protein [Fructobacillus sp. CRL 2054]MDD9138145.1 CrcB family protein [Fructobacillus sp. CRL 2054]